MAKLYIIGNGFDRHHGMATDYAQFADHLQRTNHELRDLIDDYFPTDEADFWSQFEENLAAFDADSLVDNSEHFIVPYGAEDWSDAYHHDYAWALDQVVSALSKTLVADFSAWIRQIPIPSPATMATPLLTIDPTARFITFNYTATLQSLYRVAADHVWHIHGSAADPTERLILGHAWRPATADTYAARLDPERADTRVLQGADIIDRYFSASFKPSAQIIAGNAARFRSLSDVDDIRVLGHSLSDVDLPYLQKVAASAHPAARWRISFHRDPADAQHQFAKFDDLAEATFLPITAV